MRVCDIKTYNQLLEYLRNWSTFHGDEFVYDINGIAHVMLSCLDSIKENAIPEDIEDIGECFTKEQREFFITIADMLKNKTWDDD